MDDQTEKLKSPAFWDEDYIASLPVGEFDWLEYKASSWFTLDDKWRNDMSKYISAWANYGGGFMVIGVRDPDPSKPLEVDGGVLAKLKPKLLDWLDTTIPTLVELPLRKIETAFITSQRSHSAIKQGHGVVVIHIPESEAAPHQATNRKYYQRLGRNLEELRHRALLDIAGRRRHAKIRTNILVHIGAIREPRIFWKIENIGTVMARHFKAVITFPTKIGSSFITVPDEKLVLDTNEEGKSFLQFRISNALGGPLFPGSDLSRTFKLVGGVEYDPPLEPSISEIRVTTFADEMPACVEIFKLSDVIRKHESDEIPIRRKSPPPA